SVVGREAGRQGRWNELAGRNSNEPCRVESTPRKGPSGPSLGKLGEGSSPGHGFWSSPGPLRRRGDGMRGRSPGDWGDPTASERQSMGGGSEPSYKATTEVEGDAEGVGPGRSTAVPRDNTTRGEGRARTSVTRVLQGTG